VTGNPGIGFKCALLSLLSEKFVSKPLHTGDLGLDHQALDFGSAVVLLGELDAKLPAVIRAGDQIAGAVQA